MQFVMNIRPQKRDTDGGATPWRMLAVLLVGQFLANVDTAIVNVAGPSIQDGLGASGGETALVVSGYVVAYAVLLVTGARLGATHGYRRVFATGVLVFGVSSLMCGLTPTPVLLILARIVQGAGAALMVPQVLSAVQMHFGGRDRVRALAYYAVALSGGAVAGQVLGGLLLAADVLGLGWRPVFLINVPAALFLAVAAQLWVPDDRPRAVSSFDTRGVVLLSSAIGLLIVPLVLGPEEAWPVWSWISLAASCPLAALFVSGERRLAALGGRPLVSPHAVRPPAVRWGLLAHGLTTLTYFALLFVLAIYLQHGLGRGPAYVGLTMVSWVAAFGLAGVALSRLPAPYALVRYADVCGCLLLAVCYLAVCGYLLAGHHTGPGLLALLGIGGFGLGISSNSLINRMTSATAPDYATDLSGIISTNAQLSGAVGAAALGTGYLTFARTGDAHTSAHALAATLGACAVLALVSAGAALRAVHHTAQGNRHA